MPFSRLLASTLTAAASIATLTVCAATSSAAPAPLIAAHSAGVGYTTTTTATSATTVLDGATFRVDPGTSTARVVTSAGTTVASLPLAYRLAGQTLPIAASVSADHTALTLTPARSSARTVATPIAFPRHNASSQTRFINELNKASFAAGVGAAIGAGVGLAVGCVVGIIVGCIPGILIGAGAGALIGLINAGGPSLQSAAIAYFTGRP